MSSPHTSADSSRGRSTSRGPAGGRGQNRSAANRAGGSRNGGGRPASGSTTYYSSGSYPAGATTGGMFSTGAFADSIPSTDSSRTRREPGTDRPARDRNSSAPNGAAPARGDRPARTDRPARPDRPVRNDRGRGSRRNTAADDRSPVEFAAQPSGANARLAAEQAAQARTAPKPAESDRPTTAAQRQSAPVTAGSLFAAATTVTADAAPLTDVSFAELGVPERLIKPLAALGALSPFPIQAATLPVSLTGRDVLGRGRTGSGKTIAFAVPLVTRLTGGRRTPHRPRGLVLLPTRELALQVARTIEPLAAAAGLKMVTIFGGVGFGPQISALRAGVDIVVACPGRLEDLIKQGVCNLSDVEVTVLDEADHMADLGFLPGVRRLLRATRQGGQRLLFSATLDNGISVLVNDFLHDPAVHAVDDASSHVETMTHHVFAVSKDDRNEVIRQLAIGGGRRMLFTRTKFGAKKWAAALSKNGIPAVDLHGNLSQNARERNLAAFSTGNAKVLVATDIAARGIHVDDVELVVHLDPPTEHKAYLHRSGRTARAGAGGTVITVMLPEQADDVRKLMKLAGISATTANVRPGSPEIGRLAG